MKFALLAVFAIALVATSCEAQSNNGFWGVLGFNDTLRYNYHVEHSSRWLTVLTENYTYPPKGVINSLPITAIRAFDQKTNGNGATGTIVAGGVGNTTVTVRFTSLRGHGINFQLEIYTRQCL